MGVYVFKDEASGLFKVGWSKKPEAREKTLGAQIPLVRIVKTWPDTERTDESRIHIVFKSKRVRGEWFCLTEQDIDRIDYLLTHPAEIPVKVPSRRKAAILSVADIQAIANDAITPDIEVRLIDWAKGEIERREAAGKKGGRPKGTTSEKYVEPERVIIPIDET